jgi:hypothetical protein
MREHVVDVAAKSNDPGVRIVDATSRSPYVIPNVVVDDKGNTVLKIVLSDRAPKGRFNASVKLRLGGTPAGASKPVQYEMDLPVAATLFHFVQPDPNAFFVGRVDPGGSVRHSIRLVHADGAPFKVVTADVTGDSVSGLYVRPEPFSEGSRRGVDLVLQGPVGSHMGQLRGKVHVVTDIPGEGPLQFDIMGMVRTETKK